MLRSKNLNRGFTLVELLVVIGIIAVLMSILLPTLSKARVQSRRVACAAQLRDIGNLYRIYLNDHKDRLPHVNTLPSLQPPLLVDDQGKALPSIYETIDRSWHPKPIGEAQGQGGWHCPADEITKVGTVGVPQNFMSYYDREGGSYQYELFFNRQGADYSQFYDGDALHKVFHQALEFWKQRSGKGPDTLVMFHDFEPFHGKAGDKGAMNFLFADFHVGDIE